MALISLSLSARTAPSDGPRSDAVHEAAAFQSTANRLQTSKFATDAEPAHPTTYRIVTLKKQL